jgi:hypothetical protein
VGRQGGEEAGVARKGWKIMGEAVARESSIWLGRRQRERGASGGDSGF